MKITEISKEYLEKGGLIRRKGWDLDISIGLSTSKIDFIYYENSKPKKPTTFFRGLVQDIMADDWELTGKLTQVWEPQYGEKYYTISTRGTIDFDNFVAENNTDAGRLLLGNVFETEEEAQHMLEKIKIINKLRELSNIKFNENDDRHYMIVYNKDDGEIISDFCYSLNPLPFNVFFKTREDCENAISTIGEENLKKYYFDVEEV
jgi:hypothetical protein